MEPARVDVKIDYVSVDFDVFFVLNTLCSAQKSKNLNILVQKSQDYVVSCGALSAIEADTNFQFFALFLRKICAFLESNHLVSLFGQKWIIFLNSSL
jgi:hypothetical protein